MVQWHIGFRVEVLKFRIGNIDAKAKFIQVIEKENQIEVKVLEIYSGKEKISAGQVLRIPYESIYEADGKPLPPLP